MAKDYPNSHFTGLDFAPIQPKDTPRNVNFVQANALNGLPFEDNTFDYVFQRFLVVAYPKDKWGFMISELVRVLKPGGYLEVWHCLLVSLKTSMTSRLMIWFHLL